MAVSRFVTTGVALAAAGAIAAVPAIAPPLQPMDVHVVNDVNMRLSADLEVLINVFFKSSPGDPDAPGTIGFPGIVQQLLLDANNGDARAQEVINSFFGSGASDVVRLLLTRDYPDQDAPTPAQINIFFNSGLSELVRYRLLMFNADPTQRAWINKFFGGEVNDDGSPNVSQQGFPGVFYKFLSERGLSPDQQRQLDIFWNRATPDPENPGEFIGTANPALRGFPGLFYYNLSGTGLSPDQQQTLDDLFVNGGFTRIVQRRLVDSTADPTQKLQITRFFEGGATRLVGENLLDANGVPTSAQYQAIDSFFFGYPFDDPTTEEEERGPTGFTGLVHFIIDNLMGNVTPPPAPVAPVMETFALRTTAPVVDPVDTTPVDTTPVDITPVDTATAADTGPVVQRKAAAPVEDSAAQPVAVVNDPAPAAAPAPVSAPDPAPAPVPAVDPAPASNEEDGEDGDGGKLSEEDIDSGNKFTPDPILLQNGTGGGGTAWDQTVQRWHDAFNRLGIGAPAPAPSAPSAEDPSEGGETGS